MKRFLFTIAILICIAMPAAALCQDASGGIQVEARLDQDQVPQNMTLEFTTTVRWTGQGNDYILDPADPPTLENLVLVGSTTRATKGIQAGEQVQILETTYVFKPLAIGPAKVIPPTIHYLDTVNEKHGELKAADVGLVVIDPVPTGPFSRIEVKIGLFAGALILLAAILFGIRKVVVAGKSAKPMPTVSREEQLARESLAVRFEELTKMVRRGEPGPFAQGLAELIRRWALVAYGVSAAEKTTGEFIRSLESAGLSPAWAERISEILKVCDTARFGGGFTVEQAQRIIDIARPFFPSKGKTEVPPPDPDAWLSGRPSGEN